MLDLINYRDDLPILIQLLKIERFPIHWHKDIQLIYVLEGQLNLKLTYTTYHLKKGDIHLIHTTDVHSIMDNLGDNLVLFFNINVEYFSKIFPNLENQIFTIKVENNTSGNKKKEAIEILLFSIVKEIIFEEKGYKKKVEELTIDLINVLYRDFRGFTISKEERIFSHKVTHDIFQMDRISRIISYVYENYPYKLSFTDIAKNENINNYYLSHLFQHFVGENFRSFVSMVRVEMSETKLLSTNLAISQIAQDVGFSNPKYYIDNFRIWFGYHPKEYRRLYSNKILGKVPPIIIEIPLKELMENLSPTISFETNEQILSSKTITIKLDLKTIPLGKFNFLGDSKLIQKAILPTSLIRKNCQFLYSDVARLYYNISPHSNCINLLKKIISNPKQPIEEICLIDSSDSINGLLAVNGLKKPLYYLYYFLSRMGSELIKIDKSYIITKGKNKYNIIVFNENDLSPAIIDIKLFQLQYSYKLTKSKIIPSNSCIDYWCQLNFKTNISEIDFEKIEAMSQPRISFEIIPQGNTHGLSLELEPGAIIFMEFDKIEED